MKRVGKRIFIIGNAHSGTTILYKMLAYHPHLAWFCQFSQRQGRVIPGRLALPFAAALKRTLRAMFAHDWRKRRDNLLVPRPGEMNSLWKYLWSLSDIQERKNRLKQIIDEEMHSWKREAIIIKNPWIGQYAALIDEALAGDCHFIHIVRDGRAVVHSILHKHERYHQGKDALQSATRYWVDFLGEIIAFGQQVDWKNILEVRYEDLVADIPKTLANIMTFCGLDSSRFPFDRVPKKLQSTNHKWINEANRENIRLIERGATELLQRYRYTDEKI